MHAAHDEVQKRLLKGEIRHLEVSEEAVADAATGQHSPYGLLQYPLRNTLCTHQRHTIRSSFGSYDTSNCCSRTSHL